MSKVVIGLSGGMDSATLCGYYIDQKIQVHPVIFNYGSKHNKYENEAADKLVRYYGLPEPIFIELPFIEKYFKSNLLSNQGTIPEGHYEDQSMSLTVVPGRNIIFASIMAGYAWSIDAKYVALGVHSGDHFIYADCRPKFISAMNQAILAGSDNKVTLQAPFIDKNKTSILELGYKIKVPYQYTRTCYKDQELSCGKCGSCVERLEAFKNFGLEDPIKYEI